MNIENEELEWIKIQIENNPNIDPKNTGWNHPHFTELKEKEMEFDLYIYKLLLRLQKGFNYVKNAKVKKFYLFKLKLDQLMNQ